MNNKMKTTILSAVITMTTMGVFANPVVISDHSVAIGNGVTANQNDSIALGNGVINTNNNTIGIGNGVTADTNAIAIGNGASASNINTIAIGNGVNANSTTSIAIGYGVTTDGVDSVNIGNINKGATKDSVLVGSFNNVENDTGNSTGDVLLGNSNTLQDGYHGVLVGKDNTINHADYGVAIGNGASVVKDESVAIGHNSLANTVKATPTMTVNGTTYNLSGIAPIGTIAVGNTGNERTITNVAAGRVIDGSTDAINGSQLYAAISEINTNGSKINTVTSRVVDNSTRLDTLENTTRDINTTVNNTTAQVNINTKDISDLKGKVGNSSVLKPQVDTNTANIRANEQRITTLDSKISQLERGTNSGIASVAALSSLHWNGFDAHNKLALSAGFGHYKNANAGALGAFYAPNENVMFYVGQSFGSSSVTNASVNFKVGKTTNVKRNEVKDLKERVEMLENLLTK